MRLLSLANRRGIENNNSLKWVKNSGAQMDYGVFLFSLNWDKKPALKCVLLWRSNVRFFSLKCPIEALKCPPLMETDFKI